MDRNIAEMKQQLLGAGIEFDWAGELATHSPDYFKWTQFVFLLLHRRGLVEKRLGVVNWDPVDKTVLANEQVVDGRGDRSGAVVESRLLRQYYFAMSTFAERLDADLALLTKTWPKHVLEEQRNWIGRTTGWTVEGTMETNDADHESVQCWANDRLAASCTDGLLVDANAVLVSLDNPLVQARLSPAKQQEWKTYSMTLRGAPESTMFSTNVVVRIKTAESTVRLPVYVAPFHVYSSRMFALYKHPELPSNPLAVGSTPAVAFKLRDWLVSRQRKWGTPIPMVNCADCGTVPFPVQALPILPDAPETVACPKCSRPAPRELDTLDTFVDSSFYYLRFLDPHNPTELLDPKKSRPVDVYIGGREHSCMHLLYARFVFKVLCDAAVVQSATKEPFGQLLVQGMVRGRSFRDRQGRYYRSDEVVQDRNLYFSAAGVPLTATFEKMSKSKANGIEPADVVRRWGADVVRLYILSRGHPSMDMVWEEEGIKGMERLLHKVNRLVAYLLAQHTAAGASQLPNSAPCTSDNGDSDRNLKAAVGRSQALYQRAMAQFAFHNAISEIIKLSTMMEKQKERAGTDTLRHAVDALLVLLSPFATARTRGWRKLLDAA
ncbi:hypothetical protein HDV03_005469 [Kappamyces sp. JEL0829]|nr:hypothetical protein HDV03_005469 [Kappamyces sp. JEL0829]